MYLQTMQVHIISINVQALSKMLAVSTCVQ